MNVADVEKDSWHLDKRVPLALIFAIAVQSIALVWFLAGLDVRVTNNEKILTDRNSMLERIAKTETRLEGMQETLRDIKSILQSAYGINPRNKTGDQNSLGAR